MYNYNLTGDIDPDDSQWRPLSGDTRRDLNPMTQRRMQDLALYLWEGNLLANRLIELPVAYILAEGVKLKAEDEEVNALIEKFWNHPINNLSIKLIKKVRELSLFGEQCWPAFINEYDGAVRLGYLDPGMIATIVVDPDNGEQPIGVITVKNQKGIAQRFKIIVNGPEVEMFTARTIAIRDTFSDGDCFYFCINDLSNGRRGRSDLLPQTDWLDSYDQFMFGELDRVQFLRAFMWDVTLAGATEDDVKKRSREIRPPKPGSVRVHNDAESWKVESPNIGAADTTDTAKLFRNHVLGGATIPEHWYGGAGDVNRATGEDMSGPTFKMMSLRQAYIGYMLVQLAKYAIRQWHLRKYNNEPDLNDPRFAVEVNWPEMVAKDTTRYAAALQQATQAVSMAITSGIMSMSTAIAIIQSIAGRLGVDFDAESELEAIANQPPASPIDPAGTQPPATEPPKPETLTEAKAPGTSDGLSHLTEKLAKTAQPEIDGMIASVAAMLESVGSLREAQVNIDKMYPDLDDSELAAILSSGLLAANLSGQSDVASGH